MPDWPGWIETIKTAALDAVNAEKPVSVLFGRVLGVSPLKIGVEQKMTLESPQLILTRNVTDFKTRLSFENTQTNQAVTIYNGLAAGEEVILIRLQGGQKFLVLDRLR